MNNAEEFEFPYSQYKERAREFDDESMSLSGDDDLGQARIDEYRDKSNRQEDPRRAILGALTAGLSEIATRHEAALKDFMQAAEGNLLESAHAQKGIRTQVSIVHQVYCLLNLDQRLDATEQRAAQIKAQRRSAGVAAPGPAKFR